MKIFLGKATLMPYVRKFHQEYTPSKEYEILLIRKQYTTLRLDPVKNSFYAQKIHDMRKNDVRQWWNIINTMSGRIESQSQFTIERDGQLLSEAELVESLNDYFVTVASDIPPLNFSSLPTFLLAAAPPPTLHPHEVCNKLS